ncbi:uncharacterized protein LOC131845572 isoform X2 [Achroia grisella]|uniref:uncharacterized protein LOC131845572 isoform X2 n=1 Tax=Achroia grisella TaxID=688607 RepID=UPI0027D334D8|nr:uncharacterized protein LOC131845572 isoform X2 [Achroia grisella]
MAKFIKSLFNTSDTKKSDLYDGTPSEDSTPQDIRRTYSISRSGRMKQYNKKRHTLSMELYGENYQQADKSRSVEYHVNNSTIFEVKTHKRNKSSDSKTSQDSNRSALSHRQRTLERSNEENKNH